MSAQFKRSVGRQPTNHAEERGTVQVRVVLLDAKKTKAQKGNITKSFSVVEATVSEVFAAVERALFGETP